MSEDLFLLTVEDKVAIKTIIQKCKDEFIRDISMKREPLFNELQLLEALRIMKMQTWVFGDIHKLHDTNTKDGE